VSRRQAARRREARSRRPSPLGGCHARGRSGKTPSRPGTRAPNGVWSARGLRHPASLAGPRREFGLAVQHSACQRRRSRPASCPPGVGKRRAIEVWSEVPGSPPRHLDSLSRRCAHNVATSPRQHTGGCRHDCSDAEAGRRCGRMMDRSESDRRRGERTPIRGTTESSPETWCSSSACSSARRGSIC
jgi:hypothetical protein